MTQIIILFRKYFVDSFFVMLPRLIAIMVSLIALPIILASLPIDDYGKFQFILAIQAWLIVSTGQNITSGAKRGISKGLDGTFIFAFLHRLKFLVMIGLLGIIVSFCLYYIYGFTTFSLLLMIVSLFLIFGYLFQVSYLGFFSAKKEFKKFAFWETITLTIGPFSSAIAAFFTHNVLIFAIVYFFSISFVGWIGWFCVVRKNNLISAYKRREIDKECFSFGKKLILVDLISSTEAQISYFFIGSSFGVANLALFSVANKLKTHFVGFIKRIRTLLYADFARGGGNKLIKLLNFGLKHRIVTLTIIVLFFLLLCIFASYLYINLFLPQEYQDTIIYFVILSFGLPSIALETLMHTLLEANFRYKELTVLQIVPSLIKIALIIFLGFLGGVIGICLGVVLGDWIRLGFYYFLTLKKDLALKLINRSPLLKKLSNF